MRKNMLNRMALRLASNRLVPRLACRAFSASPAATEAPSVFDKLINLTIVDPSGARRKIPAMVGESIKSLFFSGMIMFSLTYSTSRYQPVRGLRNKRSRAWPDD